MQLLCGIGVCELFEESGDEYFCYAIGHFVHLFISFTIDLQEDFMAGLKERRESSEAEQALKRMEDQRDQLQRTIDEMIKAKQDIEDKIADLKLERAEEERRQTTSVEVDFPNLASPEQQGIVDILLECIEGEELDENVTLTTIDLAAFDAL